MFKNVDAYIVDNPVLRRLQLLEVVLNHCAAYIWAKDEAKQRKASQWAEQLRDKMNALKNSSALSTPSPSQNDGGSETRKTGSNGLSVASADTIVCKKPKYHETGSADHSTVDPNELPPFDDLSATASFVLDSRLTPATTQNGNVILVNSAGESITDDLYESPEVPLAVKRLSGGITNELFHVYDPAHVEHSVVVRVYGKETERVISRESELFYQSQFIDTYVHGRNFLIYQFLYNFEPLPYYEMADEADALAEKIAAFQVTSTIAAKTNMNTDKHKREVIGAAAEDPNNVDFMANQAQAAQDAEKVVSRFDKEANYTVHSLTKWLSQISSEEIQSKVVPEKKKSFIETVELLRPESKDMVGLIDKEAAHLVQGVCHNDLLSANIMRHREDRVLKIIDFDYTKKNFLLFDIANHFNEYTGLECDYERYFPSDEHMLHFVRSYRRHMRAHLERAKESAKASGLPRKDDNTFRVFENEETFYTASEEDEEAIVRHWTSLVKFMTLCSHASWAIWSLFQEAVSNIDVDFLDYAKLRIARYMETKDAIKSLLSTTD